MSTVLFYSLNNPGGQAEGINEAHEAHLADGQTENRERLNNRLRLTVGL